MLTAAAALTTAACGGSGDLPDAPGAAGGASGELVTTNRIGRADAKNVIAMEMTQQHSAQSATASWAKGFKDILTKWAEANPDWRVELTVVPAADSSRQQVQLLERVRAGRGPDCAEIDSFVIPQFMQQKLLRPVTEVYGPDGLAKTFPFVRDVVTAEDGEAYAYWWYTDLRVLYYRTDLVPKPPQTWDEVRSAALAAKAANPKVDGILFNGGRWEGTSLDWYATLWSQGGKLVDEAGKPVLGQGKNREAALAGLRYYADLVKSGAAPRRVASVEIYDDFVAAAKADSVAMFIGGHWQQDQLKGALTQDQFAKWKVTELPGPTPDKRATGTGGWTVGVFTKDDAKAKACRDFISAVYAGPANQVTGQIPTSTSLFDTLDAFSTPFYTQLRDYLRNGHARPGIPSYNAISTALQVAISEVLSGSSTPEKALDKAVRTVEREAGAG